MKKINISLLLLTLLCSCIKKANIDLPRAEKKLFVTCFISPDDSVIGAVVRQSAPSFGDKDPSSSTTDSDIQNATVVLGDGTNNVTMPFDKELLFYKISATQFPVLSGKTYYLSVYTPDGKKVDASTTVPVGQLDIEAFDVTVKQQDTDYVSYNLNVVIKDIPNQVNYVSVYDQGFISNTDPPGYTAPYSYNTGFFDSDEKTGKTKYSISVENGIYESDSINYFAINLSVLNCSREFYLYNKSIQKGGEASGNPFTEPVLIYSNITNGFGCFGSYVGNYQNKRIR